MTVSYCPNELTYRSCNLAIRDITDAPNGRVIRGTAIVFERWQRVAEADTRDYSGSSGMREKVTSDAVELPDLSDIVNEAMDKALKEVANDVRALVNHDPERYLGSMYNRSLKLNKTQDSLDFELNVPKTSAGNDLLAVMENEGGNIPASVGFVSRGKNSNIKRINFDDEALEEAITKPSDKRAVVENVSPLDSTEINTQTGKLAGSDYIEGIGVKSGKKWKIFKRLDLREISLLIGHSPAWQGVYGQLGAGAPQPSSQQQARARELELVRLRCLVG